MPYLLDANVFIQAKNLHYGLDFCPAFWDWLIAENATSNVAGLNRFASARTDSGGTKGGLDSPAY